MSKKRRDDFVEEIDEQEDTKAELDAALTAEIEESIATAIKVKGGKLPEVKLSSEAITGKQYRVMIKIDKLDVPVYKVPFTQEPGKERKFDISKDLKLVAISSYLGVLVKRYARDLSNDELKFIAKYRS